MRLRNSLLLATLLLASCSPKPAETSVFIDPQFASLVPAGTTLLVGLRVENLVKTPIYQKYLSGGKISIVDRIARGTAINPEKSLWNLLFVSTGKQSFILGRGKFADELMAPDFSKKGVRRFGYQGFTLFGDDQQAMLMVNSSTIAIADTPTLRWLVDQRSSLTGLPERLTALTKQIPRQTQFWGAYLGGAIDLPLTGNLQNVNKFLGLVATGTFYFDFADGLKGTLTGVAANAQDAQQVHDGLQGFLGLGRMMAPKTQPQLARVFDGIQVVQEGQRVSVKITEPEDLAGTLIDTLLKQ
ncbi:MAG: hypothetical protein M3N41_05195 [Acidobacteriota bacterium]|nr:hypothetical protein [Acidobacteriota bacterium]